jgi:hypothetical protein
MAREKRSSNTVTIACKLPQGLHIVLNGQPALKLHGALSPYAHSGHGMTRNVPTDTWNAVQAQHKDAKWLTNGLVFAAGDSESAADEAEEREGVVSGFEPVDPANLDKLAPGIQNLDSPDPAAR